MAVNVNISKTDKDNAVIHHLPCVIKRNGPANVTKYFQSSIIEGDGGVLSTSFRGYPLLGKEINVPKNYTGVVLQEPQTKLSEESNRNVYTIASFDKLTYWNYDRVPSENDQIMSVMNWIDISSALHSPINS
ncbi:UNVERIFIED_CONTAM: hypothetical protein PYX00_006742 [Menopon gallinae]|uniref:Uncharacterized protein n=1 Tax=Menopon gallinae TaxID=328185 RepID=A0AAW2HWD3_9NEOP